MMECRPQMLHMTVATMNKISVHLTDTHARPHVQISQRMLASRTLNPLLSLSRVCALIVAHYKKKLLELKYPFKLTCLCDSHHKGGIVKQ